MGQLPKHEEDDHILAKPKHSRCIQSFLLRPGIQTPYQPYHMVIYALRKMQHAERLGMARSVLGKCNYHLSHPDHYTAIH